MQKENAENAYNRKAVEGKWIKKWRKDKLYKVSSDRSKEKYYCLDTFAYPSADGVHVGYVKAFGGMDIVARYKRMKGFNVLYTGGWDTLGLPAENYALRVKKHPREVTNKSIKNFKNQFEHFGLSYDWSREINTADSSYYKWTQWLFLKLYAKDLAYKKEAEVNWCTQCETVISNEQVEDDKCERCKGIVVRKPLNQWFFKVSEYAKGLFEGVEALNWQEKYKKQHRNWIGKYEDGEFVANVHDWCISRQRYWGPPIPIVYDPEGNPHVVDEKHLPWILPEDVDFNGKGKPTLKSSRELKERTEKVFGKGWTPEYDTMDTFVSSSWYQFRYPDSDNKKAFVSQEAINYWQNVDHYQGTIEHLTAHLIYARFMTRFLYDEGLIAFQEPFPKYTPVGLLVDKEGVKFSKRYANAPDTNSLVKEFGGDLLRLSCAFVGPFDDITKWREGDVVGVRRFRNKMWRVFNKNIVKGGMSEEERIDIAQLASDIEKNIEAMKFNVGISKLMVFVNTCIQKEKVNKEAWEAFTKLLALFAPFIAEEMWYQMGNEESVHLQAFP